MLVSVDLNEADSQLIQMYAEESRLSISDALRKAIRNAYYVAEIDRRMQEIASGKKTVSFTDEEWERFTYAQDLP